MSRHSNVRSLNTIRTNSLIKLPIKLNSVSITALLDSGSQSNYISSRAVQRAGLQLQQKKDLYLLHVANREPMPQELEITYKVSSVPITLSKHYKDIDLDVFRIATHNIILGLP